MTRPTAWRPLLQGAERAQALDAIREIAEALRNLPAVDLSLFSGRAGIALFFAYLSEARLEDDAEELAWGFLDEAESGIATQAMDPSLCGGFTGIAWAHAHLHQAMTGEPDRGALKQIDEALIDLLSDPGSSEHFELLYGLVGIGVYALERLPRPRARAMLRLVIERLSESAQTLPGGIAWPDPNPAQDRGGAYNLGMAHGITAVIGFLARAVLAGVCRRKAGSLLSQTVPWFEAQQLPPEQGGGYSAFVTPGEVSLPCRVAWCYGDPGVAAALWSAGQALGRPELTARALQLALSAADRPDDQTLVVDAGLCHGAAGVGHLYNRLFQASGEASAGRVARHWFSRVLNLRKPGFGVAGFAPAPAPGNETAKPNPEDPGFLTGAAGIGLALLAATTPVSPLWDRLLLVDLPPVALRGSRQDHVAGLALEPR